MSKGYIEFISGEAFSGKTSLMLKKIAVAGGKSLVITPAFFDAENPCLVGQIQSHDGESHPAVAAESADDLDVFAYGAYDFLFVDDVHLFKKDISGFIFGMAEAGTSVIVAGERFDAFGNWHAKSFLIAKRASTFINLGEGKSLGLNIA